MTQRVFVDANILVSRTCLDWLFHLRNMNEGMFQVHSTEDVFAEAAAALRKRQPRASGRLIPDRMVKVRACIDEVLPDFPSDLTFTGTDEHDYHVHAAALASGADFVLTQNHERDITQDPDAMPYEVIAPDEFFVLVTDSSPGCLIPATRQQLEYWTSRGDGYQLDDALRRAGCPIFAERVREALQHIALHP